MKFKSKLFLGVAALGLVGITSVFSPITSNASENVLICNEDNINTVAYSSCPIGHDNKEFLEIEENLLDNCQFESYDTYKDIAGQSYSYSISYKLIVCKAGKYYHYRYENSTPFVTAFVNYASGPKTVDYTISNNTVCFGFPGDANDNSAYSVCLVTKTYIDEDDEGEYVEGVEGWVYEAGDYIVSDMTPPTVEFDAVFTVNVDDMQSLDEITSHIIVKDESDPNPRIVIESTNYDYNVRKIGKYKVKFHAEDKSGNITDSYSFTINVVDVKNPIITCNDITIGNLRVLSKEELYTYFSISDNYSSKENISLVTKIDNYTANATKPGTYTYTIQATDEAGNVSEKTMNITVYDNTAPSISATNMFQYNTSQLSSSSLLSLFNVSDDVSTEGKIKKEIIVDNYTANYRKVGTYEITCRATDEAGNYSDSTITISVIDKINPTINNITKETEYFNKITDFKSLFTYSDDTSSKDNITFEIVSDEYTENYNKKGEYVVKVKVTDEAGNSSTGLLTITVIDTTAPIITAPANVEIGNSILFTIDNLKEKIAVIDGYDGNLSNYELIDENNYSTNYKTLGDYKFTIKATDSSGNSVTGTITLIVSDTTAPEIFYDSYFILVREGEELTREMIVSYATQVLGLEDGSSIVNISGEYDTNMEGEYILTLTLNDDSVKEFTISVGANNTLNEVEQIGTFIKDNWISLITSSLVSILLIVLVVGIIGHFKKKRN